jgi:hypothetical protein
VQRCRDVVAFLAAYQTHDPNPLVHLHDLPNPPAQVLNKASNQNSWAQVHDPNPNPPAQEAMDPSSPVQASNPNCLLAQPNLPQQSRNPNLLAQVHNACVPKSLLQGSFSNLLHPQPPTITDNPTHAQAWKVCSGWSGKKYNKLIQQALHQACKVALAAGTTIPRRFPLPDIYSKWRCFPHIQIAEEPKADIDQEAEHYVVCAKDCTVNVEQGWQSTKLCQHCSQFAKHISNMAKSANHDPTIQGSTTRVTAKAAVTMTPTKLKRVLTAQRRQSNCTACSLRHQVKQLKRKIETSKELHSLSDNNSKFLVEEVLQKALPYLEQYYPKDSLNYAVFTHAIQMLTKKDPRKGVRYGEATINLAFLLLKQSNVSTYDHLKDLLWLKEAFQR